MAKLVNEKGVEVLLPATLKDFRGDVHTIVGFDEPHKPSSSGKVYTNKNDQFYPSVVGLTIIEHAYS